MIQVFKSSSHPRHTNPDRFQSQEQVRQIVSLTKLDHSQSLILKKECVMSRATKCSVAITAAAMLLSSSSFAVAGDKCPLHSATPVALKKEAKMDIVDTAVNAGSFKTLAAALKAAGLVDTLKGTGPFTVFAPTDEAFAKLPPGTVETLLKPENKAKLAGILTYHVVSGNVKADDVVNLKSAKTVQGSDVKIVVKGKDVMINAAKVVAVDIEASNGVIHVIDSVIMPPAGKKMAPKGEKKY